MNAQFPVLNSHPKERDYRGKQGIFALPRMGIGNWELGIGKLLRCRLMASLPRMVQGRFHVTLYLQTDHSHQLQSVTLLYDAGEHAVAEEHFALFQVIFEMDVCRAWRQRIRDCG